MNDDRQGLARAEERLTELGRRVVINSHHKAHLRDELVRRHQELIARNSQRGATMLGLRIRSLKRLTLVAPPALALALIVFIVTSGLQVSGRRETQQALAARITLALVRTVPTVNAWQVTMEQSRGTSTSAVSCNPVHLGRKRLYMRGAQLYVYAGKWYELTPASIRGACSAAWQWVFRGASLARDRPAIVADGAIGGHSTLRVTYRPKVSHGSTYRAQAWVDRSTGLVLRLQTSVERGGRIVEVDRNDYSFGMRTGV